MVAEGVQTGVFNVLITPRTQADPEVKALENWNEYDFSTLNTDADYVAQNTATEACYATVKDALDAAREGETVILLADVTETTVMVTPGITLDLNGKCLWASYAVAFDTAHFIDSAQTGRLNIGIDHVVLDEENAMLPVYDGEGFIFTKAGFALRQDSTYTGEGIRINAMAYPTRMEAVELLKDGGSDNAVQIVILLSWTTIEGTGYQEFVFTESVVGDVYTSNQGAWNAYGKMFSMTITGISNIENLKANMVIVSDTNAAYISSTSVSIT